jgi:hypothetical protein
MKSVKDFIDEAINNGFKVETLDNAVYMIDYPLSYAEGMRYQVVYVRDHFDDSTKKQTYYINSYICEFSSQIDPLIVLREANFGRLSMVCLKNIPDGQGGQKEALYTQCTIPCSYINDDYKEFMSIVFEVASNADYIEKIFFAEDKA